MVNGYLVVAYALVWAIFMIYAWSIQSRQKRLEKEIAELKGELGARGGRDSKSPI